MTDGPMDNDGAPDRSGSETSSRSGAYTSRRGLRSPGEALQPEAPPPPPPSLRKRRPILATASAVLSFIGIAAIAAIAALSFGLQKLSAPGPLPGDKTVYIESGTDTGDIIAQLEHEGVIDSWPLMTAALYLRGERHSVKFGEYLFKEHASLNEVIDTLVAGKPVLHAITIPEGLTSEQVVDRLMEDDTLAGTVRAMPKEGTLMPDTYKFARGTKRDQIIANMQQEQKRIVAEVWSHRSSDTTIKSPYEMLTLASIVEKETGKADERPRVAGVFVNRLARNIPLQSDPTIVYGLVGGKGTLGRGILRSEIEQRTPYNTYVITGLPPGPICNPGRAAMEAVATPSRTREIYFVADGTGGHAFAETLDQHRANVVRYRQIEKDARDKLPSDSDKLLQAPPGSPVAKPNQRGDSLPSVPVFGALDAHAAFPGQAAARSLPKGFGLNDLPMTLSQGDNAFAAVKPMLPDDKTAEAPAEGDGDDLGTIPGVNSSPPPAASAEEKALADGDGQGLTFPVSAARRADEKAQAAAYGLSGGSDKLPPQSELISNDPAAASAHPAGASGPRRIYDASEGTKLDPLLNKSYDLMSAKTVPAFAAVGAVSKH